MIPYGKQNIDQGDLDAVKIALLSEFVTQGPRVGEFEKSLESYTGAKHAVAVNSATSALHLACLSLGVGPGDLVWTSAVSFVASANAALYCGASVDFVDIDPLTFNLSSENLATKLENARENGLPIPKVLIAVHMAGQPCDMEKIGELAREYSFRVIEDASHALGSTYKGARTGSCQFSDITVFSFHAVKMITTGEGGMCLTNSAEIAARIQRLRSHGITRDPNETEFEYQGAWYYEQLELGFNYRMTDFQAALGKSQMSKLDAFVNDRNQIAKWYRENLNNASIKLPILLDDGTSSFHLFIVLLPDPISRKAVFEKMRSDGILVNVHYLPIYRHPYYAKFGKYSQADFPNAEDYYARCISLPIFPGLSQQELEIVKRSLGGSFGHQNLF